MVKQKEVRRRCVGRFMVRGKVVREKVEGAGGDREEGEAERGEEKMCW